ncbi:hypothetical protein [Staphylococcus aureus]
MKPNLNENQESEERNYKFRNHWSSFKRNIYNQSKAEKTYVKTDDRTQNDKRRNNLFITNAKEQEKMKSPAEKKKNNKENAPSTPRHHAAQLFI